MKSYKKISLIFLLIIIGIFTSCERNITPITKETFMLGTIVDIKLYGKNGDIAMEACIKKLADIENKMSVNKDNSEVSCINKNAGKKPLTVSNDVYYVINKAINYSNISSGAFDITVDPLVKLWGIGTDHPRVPSKSEINKAMSLIDYKSLVMGKNHTIYLKRKNMAIDLGGIAKGYAADELKKVIKSYGITSAFINLGGNVYAIGSKIDKSEWKIGIQNPLEQRGEYVGILKVKDKSIVTSGNYERYFIKNGKRYHHIFDTKTGYPSENGLISITIISDNSIDGDALSTATYVLGLQKGIQLIKSLKGVDAVFITSDKKVYVTPGIKDTFKLTNNEFSYGGYSH